MLTFTGEKQTHLAELDWDLTRRLSVLVAADKVDHKLISPTPTVGSFLALLTTIDTTVASPIISNQTASHLMNLIKNLKSQKLNTVLYH